MEVPTGLCFSTALLAAGLNTQPHLFFSFVFLKPHLLITSFSLLPMKLNCKSSRQTAWQMSLFFNAWYHGIHPKCLPKLMVHCSSENLAHIPHWPFAYAIWPSWNALPKPFKSTSWSPRKLISSIQWPHTTPGLKARNTPILSHEAAILLWNCKQQGGLEF